MNCRLTVLSAFSGLGGLDLGLEAVGFDNVGCIEFDHIARRSLKANRGDAWPLLEPGDIRDVAATVRSDDLGLKRGDLTLLAGGPPCQPFSKAAQWVRTARSGLADPRAQILLEFLELVDKFLPAAVLIENVPGFVRGEVSALAAVDAELNSINERHSTNYQATSQIVDAAEYGVPQHRHRAIVVAFRDQVQFGFPTATHIDAPTTAWDAIGHIPPSGFLPRATGKWARLLPTIPEGQNYLFHTDRGAGLPIFGYRTRYWSFLLKLARDEPAWTLPAQPGPSTGPFHWDNRPLSIPEMLALQTFPNDWIVEGDLRAQVRQVGNATPPLLAEIIGRAIREALQPPRAVNVTPLTHAVTRRMSAPPPSGPKRVPEEFLRLVGVHAAHPGTGLGPRPRLVATSK